MQEIFINILKTTYAVILPVLLGWLVKHISAMKADREAHKQANTEINNKLDTLTRLVEENEMRTARYRIIRFDDEKASGIAHSSDHCDQILEDCDIYKNYCNRHPEFQNHKGQGAMLRIEEADNNNTLEKAGY